MRNPRATGAAVVLAAALMTIFPPALHAHDPGLSALDVRLGPAAIRVSLSLAPADAAQSVEPVDALASAGIAVAIDGVPLAVQGTPRMERGDAGVTVVLTFTRHAGSRLTIRSDVPRRLAAGHRQLLTVRAADGRVAAERMLGASSGAVDVELGTPPHGGVAAEFLALGLHHILGGYDHLLFLIALLLGVGGLRGVITTVTAFTLAHSVTLSLAVLGVVAAPPGIVEPLIAASIVFVGMENLVRRRALRLKGEAMPPGSRWPLTFAFGLVHGFGFAGALRDLGIGERLAGVALPLASFNAGVELGQVVVVLALWPMLRLLNDRAAWRARFAPAMSAAIVVAGCYWLVERLPAL